MHLSIQTVERQPIDTRTLLRPLFVSDGTSEPEPIDISKLSKPVGGIVISTRSLTSLLDAGHILPSLF